MGQKQTTGDVTELLRQWSGGDKVAGDRLARAVYQQLKQMARAQMAGERNNHTLQPTALVHEAYLKLADGRQIAWQDRAHFFAVAAQAIRQILVDSGRRHRAEKRGAGRNVTLQTDVSGEDGRAVVDLLALDAALEKLAKLQPDQARIVELRYFAGLTIAETAVVMNLSTATANRYWRTARAWLHNRL